MKLIAIGWNRKRFSLALAFGTVTAFSMTPLMDAVSRAGTEAAANITALMDARSPGGRADGALLQTKAAKLARSRTKPQSKAPRQYAMPKFREPAAAALPGLAAAPTLIPEGAPIPLSQIASLQPSTIPVPPISIVPPDVIPPAGGGGGGGEQPPTPGPVPEPAAWMQLIVGFGAIGALLRFRGRQRSPDSRERC